MTAIDFFSKNEHKMCKHSPHNFSGFMNPMCYRLNVCVPKIHILKPSPPM